MDWRHNMLVVEKILCHLNLPDLKSASATCTSWLTASAKAFEATSRVVIPDPQPEDAPNLFNFLQRFQRIKEFKFKLRGRESTSNGLNCILTDLPLETSSTLTNLTLDYEPRTAEVLEAINSFLAQLTSRFPALKQLQICSNADPVVDLVSPSFDSVSFAEHRNLTVLRVPIGPVRGSGIDWRFLASLKKLERLDLLKFHIRGEGPYVHGQLTEFVRHFPGDAQISTLNLHLRLGLLKTFLRRTNVQALKLAFRAIKPETCTIYIEQVESDDRFPPGVHIQHSMSVVDGVVESPNLQKISVHYSMPLSSFMRNKDLMMHVWALVTPLRHKRRPAHNSRVLLRVDICSQDASPPITFFELECRQFQAPLILRYGPIGEYAERFEKLSDYVLERWTISDRCHDWPVPQYNALRKYTFGENHRVVEHEQFYPAERFNNDAVAPFPGRVQIAIFEPGFCLWRKTEFSVFPHSTSIINAQPSCKSQSLASSAENVLPVSKLFVYSID